MSKKKFFNDKVYNSKKKVINIIIIVVCIIGVIICFALTSKFNNKNNKEAKVELRDSLTVEVNTKVPDKTLYFTELENVSEDDIDVNYTDVDLTKIGSYDVTVTVLSEKHVVKLNVTDTTKPTLVLKEVNIKKGGTYTYSDFVDSCSDNSKEECVINFYTYGTDENGTVIDYSTYKNAGTYQIKIIAKDSSNNETIEATNLIIGNKTTTNTCSYGNLEYDTNYIITSYVDSSNCAIDPTLINDTTIRKNINSITETETKKIQGEVNSIKGLKSTLTINRNINAVLNKEGKGIVGFSLQIEIVDKDNKTIVRYTLNNDGKRTYYENPYNLS